jgi:cytochrome c553
MKFRSLAMAGLFAALASVAAPLLAEGDPTAGKNKTAMCDGCHGIPGFRAAYPETYQVPKLGGQNPGYIVTALKAYKAGARKNPMMMPLAQGLSKQDIKDLAAYYSSLKGDLRVK